MANVPDITTSEDAGGLSGLLILMRRRTVFLSGSDRPPAD